MSFTTFADLRSLSKGDVMWVKRVLHNKPAREQQEIIEELRCIEMMYLDGYFTKAQLHRLQIYVLTQSVKKSMGLNTNAVNKIDEVVERINSRLENSQQLTAAKRENLYWRELWQLTTFPNHDDFERMG